MYKHIKETIAKKRYIEQWMKQNRSFVKLMDSYVFEIAKGTMAPDDKFDAKFGGLCPQKRMNFDFLLFIISSLVGLIKSPIISFFNIKGIT